MNALVNEFKDRLETIKAWRHHLHKHPELSLEEAETAKYIADLVKSWGYDVVEGIGQIRNRCVLDGRKWQEVHWPSR